MKVVLNGVKAYTERHYTRLEKVGEDRFMLRWALQQMDGAGGGDMVVDGLTNGHSDKVNGIASIITL